MVELMFYKRSADVSPIEHSFNFCSASLINFQIWQPLPSHHGYLSKHYKLTLQTSLATCDLQTNTWPTEVTHTINCDHLLKNALICDNSKYWLREWFMKPSLSTPSFPHTATVQAYCFNKQLAKSRSHQFPTSPSSPAHTDILLRQAYCLQQLATSLFAPDSHQPEYSYPHRHTA